MSSPAKRRAVELDRKEKARYNKATELVEKVKRFSISTGDYQIFESFWEVVESYEGGLIKDKRTVLRMGKKIFADSPELLREFEAFYADPNTNNQKNDFKKEKEEDEKKIKKPRFTCTRSNRPIPEESPNNNNRQIAHKGVRVSRNNKVAFVPSFPPIPEESPDNSYRKDEKRISRSARVDLSETETCGPSYRRIPEDSPARKDRKSEVLNHDFEIKIPEKGSAPRAMSKEENKMIAFEDKCYPLDMHFHRTELALESAEKLLRLLEENPNFEVPIRVEDHLTIFSLNCIRKLFPTRGGSVIEAVRTDPRQALPILIPVLKEKKDYCQKFRKNMKFR